MTNRTQEELSRRPDHIYRWVQGGPFPSSTGVLRSYAPLPPPVVPTASSPSPTSPAASTIGIFLHSSSPYVLYVDQIRSTDRVSPYQTFTYRFPFQQLGLTAKPRWGRPAKGPE